jgi:oxygen-independent coproporphyrinogen-3 oxidase
MEQDQSPVAERETMSGEERARERLVIGLRRLSGLDLREFSRETGFSVERLGGEALQRFIEQGFLERTGTSLRLTRRGLLISDSLWPYLLG